jgi:hypothetical protein
MPEEIGEGTGDRYDRDARRDARRRESRWWKGGLIAALVFLGLATLFNGIAYRRFARAQQRLTIALIHQAKRTRLVPMGSVLVPFPGAANYVAPGRGWNPGYPNEQEQQQKQVPSGQSTPSQ